MKKKIIAVLAAVLLLGVSSVAYAAPAATNCLEYANAQSNVLGISNSLYDALGNCASNVAGINFVSSLPDCGDSVAVNGLTCSSNQLSTILNRAALCENALSKACAKVAAADKKGSTDNGSNTNAVENVTSADLNSALETVKTQLSGNANTGTVSNVVISGANCNNSRFSSMLNALLKQLITNSNCVKVPVTSTPAATAKPTATPAVTATPAATAKPNATPAVTTTPAATAKPTATPAVTATPVVTTKPVETPVATETPAATKKPELSSDADNLSYEKQVVELVNEQRAAYGLNPLTLSSKLSDVARLKSQDMHDNNYFSHTSPTYGSPFDMMKTFGISYRTAGENIAKGYATPQAVVTAWMNSEGHRANILNANYTTIGVGYVASGNYWTQEFIG